MAVWKLVDLTYLPERIFSLLRPGRECDFLPVDCNWFALTWCWTSDSRQFSIADEPFKQLS